LSFGQLHDLQNHYQASEQKVKYLTQREVIPFVFVRLLFDVAHLQRHPRPYRESCYGYSPLPLARFQTFTRIDTGAICRSKVEATLEEAKLRHALRAMMTEMEELDSEKTAEMQRARQQVSCLSPPDFSATITHAVS